MATKLSSFRLPEDMLSKVNTLAKQQDRSANYLINLAVKRMIAEHEALAAAVDAGLKASAEGRVVAHGEVKRRSAALLASMAKRAAAK